MTPNDNPVNVGVIGVGHMGAFHAESVAHRLTNARLAAIADPGPGAASRVAQALGCPWATTDTDELFANRDIEAVVIASPARFHTDLVEAAANAGKAVYCEKPMALTLADADRAISAARQANVPLQIGFNRRWDRSFAEGHAAVAKGEVGTPQLLRSLTRDPGPFKADPSKIPQWTIFYETLIHDFDTLLWLNQGARPVEVHAMAEALIRPDFRDRGHLDTAVVTLRFDNGALAVAEASFSALYGYDVRGEVFGSEGMVTMGDVRRSSMTHYGASGVSSDTWRMDTERFTDGYTAQLQGFVESVRDGEGRGANGHDARTALAVALACIESVKGGRPVRIDEVG